MGDDGSVVVAGWTEGDGDMVAFKLDADGKWLWSWQVTVACGKVVKNKACAIWCASLALQSSRNTAL